MHRTYIGGIERGERNVSFKNLVSIATALGVSPSQVVAEAEGLLAGLCHDTPGEPQ